jgi:hypothetical protein
MDIQVKEETLGECNITTYIDIDKDAQYLIKSLCILQILCMNSREDEKKSREFYEILKEATDKASKLFNQDKEDLDIDATAQFR